MAEVKLSRIEVDRLANACTAARQIPTSLAATLPSLGLSIKDLKSLTERHSTQIAGYFIMRTAVRLYLGEVLGIYRYGSVSGKHESFTNTETVDGLSYLGLKVYAQKFVWCNFFYHMVLANESGHSLALFTHAPISELVYLLTGSHLDLKDKDEGLYSISSGNNGWECWQALTTQQCIGFWRLAGRMIAKSRMREAGQRSTGSRLLVAE
ncbi:hypothetical protein DFH07DRAFT_784894 [Mycena maculata]|uniref:Uncharacterized protein n=1 Tax=Mycena maculata TaxID=230809 RepID=A0AAD7HDZ6_9AGAR|nr:hypothetical protein DFH07DRAFT_784894 [Mycena maculata]